MPPVDPTFVIQTAPYIILIGLLVNAVMFAAKRIFTGTYPENPDNWWNKFNGRWGPVLSIGIGLGAGLLWKEAGWAIGIIGGAGAAWNFNFFQATIKGK